MKRLTRTALVIALWWASAAWAAAQQEVTFKLSSTTAQAQAGKRFEAVLETRVQDGWHLYSMTQPEGGPIPTTIEVQKSPVFQLDGDIVQPPVRKVFDENFQIDTEYIEGEAEFLLPIRVAADAQPGKRELAVSVRFMVCSDTRCLPPQTKRYSLDLDVVAASGGQAPAAAAAKTPQALPAAALARPAFQEDLLTKTEEVEWRLSYEGDPIRPQGIGKASLQVDLQEGWHIYSMTQPKGGPIPTTVKIADNRAFELAAPVVQPEIRKVYDPNFQMDAEYIDGGEFVIPFLVKDDVPDGIHPLTVEVRFSVCNDVKCLPPRTLEFTAGVEVAGSGFAGLTEAQLADLQTSSGSSGSQPEPAVAEEPAAGDADGLPAGVLAYIGFAMAMGGLALLTPCVFPMIPITVSYFTKRAAKTRGQAIREAGLYSLGIILTFTLLGFALTLLLGAGGINRLAASPLVNLFIAGVFVVFALSLFGVLELKLPDSWLNAANRKSSASSGVVGIMLMALTFSLTSFTCTVPFVGTVMVAALDGDWLWSLLGISAFALVFSAPFFLLAVFPSWLQSLPKSGNWMNSVKITMGFVELAAAVKFFSNIDLVYQWEFLTRPVFITVWLAIALVTTAYLLNWFRFSHETPAESVGAIRVLSAVFFLSISFYLLRGLFGFPLGELDAFLPPRDYGGLQASFMAPGAAGTQDGEQLEWGTDYQAALRRAGELDRPVFIDFTGYTCTNCRWMEENVFPLAEVRSRFGQMVLVRLYTDGTEAEHESNLEFEKQRFGTIALPLYAIMTPQDEILAKFEGLTRDPEEFVRFLDKALQAHDADKLVMGR